MLNHLLKYLKARSTRNIAPPASEATLSRAAQLASRHQVDLLQFVLDSMAEGV
jgi:hypothetical protein